MKPLAWEPPNAAGAALKRQKRKKERKKKEFRLTGILGLYPLFPLSSHFQLRESFSGQCFTFIPTSTLKCKVSSISGPDKTSLSKIPIHL